MSIPDVSKLQKMVKESYEEGKSVEDWDLIKSTPTLKFYFRDGSLVIAIRGTADARDIKADVLIAFGQLENSDRFKEDLAKVQEVIQQVEPSHVFGVGHSLGGAILDLFLKKGLIEKGVSYNPAVQPQDITRTLPNRRIYMSSDPLYLLIGRFLSQKPEVRDSKQSLFTKLVQLSPTGNVLTANSYLKSHYLDQFEGGGCPKCGRAVNSEVFKKKHDIPASESLTIKEIAKLSGMPVKALKEVYDKGMGAYYSNPESVRPTVKSPEQWAMGRVYSFAMKKKTTFGKADKSIAEKYNLIASTF